MYGYAGYQAIIDLTKGKVDIKETPRELMQRYIGGRGFNSRILYDNVPKGIDPFGTENILVISVGPLAGTVAPSSGRMTISAKSPATRALGDANTGGHFGMEMKFAGFDSLIIKGKSPKPVYIEINDRQIEIKDASHLWGLKTNETHDALYEQDSDAEFMYIGPAGENLVYYAAVMNDIHRAAARTGMGAVMGSKNLKAISVKGTGAVEIANIDSFLEKIDEILDRIFNDRAFPSLSNCGTPFLNDLAYESGGLAVNNSQTCEIDMSRLSAKYVSTHYYYGSMGCAACPISCGKFAYVPGGRFMLKSAGGPEYESFICLGTKCGINDPEAIIYANNLANEYGMDTISLGDTIAFSMEIYERGLLNKEKADGLDLRFGNIDAWLEMIHKIAFRKGFGDILANGVRVASDMLGEDTKPYALHVKGLEPPAYDVRAAKGFGLGWAVSTRGADHLRALPNFELLGYEKEVGEEWFGSPETTDPYEWRGKAKLVFWHENLGAAVDSAEMCKYTCFSAYAVKEDDLATLLAAATGISYTGRDVLQSGERIVMIERLFNLREGQTAKDDNLPQRYLKEPFKTGAAAGQVVEIDKMLPEFYKIRGLDMETGKPYREKLVELGLLEDAEKYGLVK